MCVRMVTAKGLHKCFRANFVQNVTLKGKKNPSSCRIREQNLRKRQAAGGVL